MRSVQISLALLITLVAGSSFGQYYMFDADEYGLAFEYVQGKSGDVTTNGFGLTVKGSSSSGFYLTFAEAEQPNGQMITGYNVGCEYFFSPGTDSEFYPAVISSIRISNTDYPDNLSITALKPAVALGYVFPLGTGGRNISTVGLSSWFPISSPYGIDLDARVYASFSSTQAVRLSPRLILAGGASYNLSLQKESQNSYELKVGLMIATKRTGKN